MLDVYYYVKNLKKMIWFLNNKLGKIKFLWEWEYKKWGLEKNWYKCKLMNLHKFKNKKMKLVICIQSLNYL
jgi:hypothetical protein